MQIYKGLKLGIQNVEVVSFIGGGGKTTTMFELGKELKKINKKVLITTTTAIYNPEEGYDYYFLKDIDSFNPREGSITIFGDRVEKKKLFGDSPEKIDDIFKRNIFDYILIEADGSKRKPIKGHAHYEPVIPKQTTHTIGIIGLDSLDEEIKGIVHRPEIFTKIINTKYSDIINEETIVRYVLNPKGIFKETQGKRVLILNKAHDEGTIIRGNIIREMLLNRGFKDDIFVADIKNNKFY